jgi:formamidopyrimidine-DNA glycosylase
MSIELPEAEILGEQMKRELRGKIIESYQLKDHERLQKIGMLNRDSEDFNRILNGRIESVSSRGNVILVKLDNGMNIVLGPEYGGKILYHAPNEKFSGKYHLKVDFSDSSSLTVRLTSMGIIFAVEEGELRRSYVYRRDFNPAVLSPTGEEFTFERFSNLLRENNRMLKSVLVGKDAVVVGLSNSAFQDIIYRAKLHPKRKASGLNEGEMRSLYEGIVQLLKERIGLKGKDQFHDLYGNKGGYTPAMGPNMKGQSCPECGTPIERLGIGGGHVYLCPQCQR